MKLRAYLKTLIQQASKLGDRNFSSNQSAVVPVEMQQELDKCIDENLKNFLDKVLEFLDKHPESPFHELMAVEFLLAKIIFSPKIAEKLNESKTEIAQTIQNLYYLLEKPHPETASSGYNERRPAQEDYLKNAIMANRSPGEKDDPLMLLALKYCLDEMDDDTFHYLTKDLEISSEKVTHRSSLAKQQEKLFSFAVSGQIDPKYFVALATLEFYRVSPTHRTEEKHAAKNQRFYKAITRLFHGDNIAAGSLLSKTDASSSEELISPPRPGFSNTSSSVLCEDEKRVYDKITPLIIRASGMVFHFSASLPDSSKKLLDAIQTPATPEQNVLENFEREGLFYPSQAQLLGTCEQDGSLLCDTGQNSKQSNVFELESVFDLDSLSLSSQSDQLTLLGKQANSPWTDEQPLTLVVPDDYDPDLETSSTHGMGLTSVPSVTNPNDDTRSSLSITAFLSPGPSAHAVENSYQVPTSGNCCYSSIIVALMHGFFSGSIHENSLTANALNMQENLFHKIEKNRMKIEGCPSIEKQFTFLLDQYKNSELQLLETIMVPALREVIAEYALATDGEDRNTLCVRCFEGQEQQHQEKFVRYFSKLQDDRILWGGPADLAVVEQMYHVRITDSRDQELLERSDEERTRPHMIIHHMRDTERKDHYEVLLTGPCNLQVKSFCDAVMKTYEDNKHGQESDDFQIALKESSRGGKSKETANSAAQRTPPGSWRGQAGEHLSSGKSSLVMFGNSVGSKRSQESSASRLRSIDSTRSVTSFSSVQGSVSVRQRSNSKNFSEFKTAITQYYAAPNAARDALSILVNIVTSLSYSSNGIVVYAPVAIAALKKNADRLDDIYAHLYILLYSIVFATRTTAASNNPATSAKAAKAVEVKKDAATILEWLSNPQDDTLVPKLIEVHARMLEKECSAEVTPLQMLSWRDESRCSNLCDKSYLDNPSSNIDNAASTILSGLPFMWSSLYTNGAYETNDRIIEKRRHYEVITAYALQDILNDSLRDPLSIEAQWLTLKAIADYNKVRAYQKKHPESRLLAESPFFNAIRLLAVTYPLASINASDQIREQELCQHLYGRVVLSLFRYEGQLLRQQKLLKEELLVLVLKVEKSIKPVSISVKQGGSSETSSVQSSRDLSSVSANLFPDEEVKPESVGSNSPGDASSISYWSVLDKKHSINESVDTAASLTEDEIKFILSDFDRKCTKTIDDKKSDLLRLLDKALDAMQKTFKEPNNHRPNWFSMFSLGRRESPPINFDSFIDCIAPKESLPPYAFAQYCVYQSKRINEKEEIGRLLRHEDHFIRKHLVSLYVNREALNSMKVSETEGLGDYVAPEKTSTKTSAIGMIYNVLNLEITALEAKGDNMTLEEIKPHYDMLFSKKLKRAVDICAIKASLKGGDCTISQRITNLYDKATCKSTPTFSKK